MKQLSEKSIQIVERLSVAKTKKQAKELLPILRKEGYNQYSVRYHYEKMWLKESYKKRLKYINKKNREYALDKKK